jgi:hypothetical protein
MTAPGNGILLTVLIIVFGLSSGYAAGRIHQWYRTSLDRDEAYRDGYDTATQSLFSVAARAVKGRRADKAAARGTATVSSILEAPGAALGKAGMDKAGGVETAGDGGEQEGKHTLPEALTRAKTYRLTPDRIARAKVRPRDLPPGEQTTVMDAVTDLPAVPKPRAS